MGAIKDCLAAGIPQALLLPCLPWDKTDKDGKSAGKMPAYTDGSAWLPLKGWQKGDIDVQILNLADTNGGNCGLLAGVPCAGFNFLGVDLDLDQGQEVHQNRILNHFIDECGHAVIRETVPYRALLLFNITDLSAGRKQVYWVSLKDGTKIGKIEVLAKGQQFIIAGRHHSGNDIGWYVSSNPDVKTKAPDLSNLITFKDFPAGHEAVRRVLEDLNQFGYVVEAAKGSTDGEVVPNEELAPRWVTPEKLISLLNRMPNPRKIDRDAYVSIMLAISATMHGIKANAGGISVPNIIEIGIAAAKWAAKHEDPKQRGNFEDELEKWNNDYSHYPEGGFRTSWDRLLVWAEHCGLEGAISEDATNRFIADEADAPISDEQLGLKIDTIQLEEELRDPPGSELSDVHIADYMRHATQIGQRVAYVPELKTWLLWQKNNLGWLGDPACEQGVRFLITQELKKYANKYSQEWTTSQKNGVLSETRVKKITTLVGDAIVKRPTEINKSALHIQTPDGYTYNLVTGTPIGLNDRKLQFDVRYTGVPVAVTDAPCPRFDEIVMQLADDNPDVFEWMWHYFGYCLLGYPRADCFLVIWGPGGNGKTVLVNVLNYVFGSYAVSLDSKVIFQNGNELHPTSLNRMRYKRLACVSETEKDKKWNETIIKRITGGDEIEARNMNKDATGFKCEAGLLVVCNDIPKFSTNISLAIERRFRMAGTTKQPLNRDNELEDKIKIREGSAILRKLMNYARKVYEGGGKSSNRIDLPPVPTIMATESAKYLYDSDPFLCWARTECDFGPHVATHCEVYNTLKARFERWLAKHGGSGIVIGDKISDNEFKKKLSGIGISTLDKNGRGLKRVNRTTGHEEPLAKGIRFKVSEVDAA